MARRISSPDFVGRQDQLEQLIKAFEAPADVRARLVVVAGEAGIGKSRLIQEFRSFVVGRGGRLVEGRCVELGDEGLPFAPIIDLLSTLERDEPAGAVGQFLGEGSAELLRLVPSAETAATPALDVQDPTAQARLFAQFAALLNRLGEDRRTVAVIEDVHWADRSTRDLIGFLARVTRRAGVLIVVTYRVDALHRRHPLRPLLAELSRLDTVEHLEVPRFGTAEVAAQVRGILGRDPDAGFAEELRERSDGNPFFIEELVASRSEGAGHRLPETLRDVVIARIDRLDSLTQLVLRAMSVIGRRTDHRLVAALTKLSSDDLISAVRAAIDDRVLVALDAAGAAGYEFRHALVQEALYDELLPAERSVLHRDLAVCLEELKSEPGSRVSHAEIAHHWERAHEPTRAVAASVRAANEATALLAYGEAQLHFERILALWSSVPAVEAIVESDRATIAERAADAAAASGSLSRAIALDQEALRQHDASGDVRGAVRVRHQLARYLWDHGAVDEASAMLTVALERSDRSSVADRALLLTDIAEQAWHAGRYAAMHGAAEEAVGLATDAGDSLVEARARALLGGALASLGDVAAGRRELERARRIEDVGAALRSHHTIWLTHVLELGGFHREAADIALADLTQLTADGVAGWLAPYEAANALDPLIQLGRWVEADSLLATLESLSAGNRATSWVHESISELHVLRGDLDAAEGELKQARQIVALQSSPDRMWLARAEALLLRARRRLIDARATLGPIIEASEDPAADLPLASLLTIAIENEADIAVAADARRDAIARDDARARGRTIGDLIAALAKRGDERIGPAGPLMLAKLAAERARLDGQPNPDLWSLAASAAAANGQVHDEARWRFRESEAVLLTAGNRRRASDALTRARLVAKELGAMPLLSMVDDLATRARIGLDEPTSDDTTRVPVTGMAPTDRSRLSAREREVLELVALGRTNQEIADALFISQKTASVHVTHILDKLGVGSRVEAALLAAQAGMIESSEHV